MAKCAYHPDREAVGACANCGRLICPECKVVLAEKTYCSSCANEIYLGKSTVEAQETKRPAAEIISTEIPKVPKGSQTYTDEAVGFSISYPETWKRMSESADYLAGFEAPEAKYGATATCVVVHEEVSASWTLHTYFTKTKENMQKRLKQYTAMSEEELTIDEMPAIKHVYTFSDKKTTHNQMLVCLKQGKVGWVVTSSSSPEAFNSYRPTFESIAASFHMFGTSRGEKATFVMSTGAMKSDIRGWGIGLIIMGIIQIAVPALNAPWGGVLIALGILEIFIQHRALYIVNGVGIIVAGIMNIMAAIEGGGLPVGFAVIQFIWGINEIRKFFKYRSAARAPSLRP